MRCERGVGAVLRLCLSGPGEVLVREASVDPGPPQRRAVLAALAVDAGRSVPVEVLIDRVLGHRAPGRRVPRPVRAHRPHPASRRAPGRGRRGTMTGAAQGRRLPTRPRPRPGRPAPLPPPRGSGPRDALPDRTRAARLRQALDLWRGEPFAGLSGSWPARMRATWRRRRVDAAVRLAAIETRSDQPAAVLGQLTDLLGEYPLTEPLAEVPHSRSARRRRHRRGAALPRPGQAPSDRGTRHGTRAPIKGVASGDPRRAPPRASRGTPDRPPLRARPTGPVDTPPRDDGGRAGRYPVGAPGPAIDAWRRSLDLFDELGPPEADFLRGKLRDRAPAKSGTPSPFCVIFAAYRVVPLAGPT